MPFLVITAKGSMGPYPGFNYKTKIPIPGLPDIPFPPSFSLSLPSLPGLPALPDFNFNFGGFTFSFPPSLPILTLPTIGLPSFSFGLPSLPSLPAFPILNFSFGFPIILPILPFPQLPFISFSFPGFPFFTLPSLPSIPMLTLPSILGYLPSISFTISIE